MTRNPVFGEPKTGFGREQNPFLAEINTAFCWPKTGVLANLKLVFFGFGGT